MNKAIITIAFDDGYLDTYTHAIPYLDVVGVKCTFGVPAALIGKTCERRKVVGWHELAALKDKGHEIASHTLNHVNLLSPDITPDKAEKEITQSKKALEDGLGGQITSFVYPYIDKLPDKQISKYVTENYSSARISENKPVINPLQLTNKYSLKGFCVNMDYKLEDLEKEINDLIEKKAWLIEVFHLVGDENTQSAHRKEPYRFFMNKYIFKKHFKFILSKVFRGELLVLPQYEVIERYAGLKKS